MHTVNFLPEGFRNGLLQCSTWKWLVQSIPFAVKVIAVRPSTLIRNAWLALKDMCGVKLRLLLLSLLPRFCWACGNTGWVHLPASAHAIDCTDLKRSAPIWPSRNAWAAVWNLRPLKIVMIGLFQLALLNALRNATAEGKGKNPLREQLFSLDLRPHQVRDRPQAKFAP